MGAGLWLAKDSYVDTTDSGGRSIFTIRIKVRPDTQTATGPCIVTDKGYFAAGFNDFPWELSQNSTAETFVSTNDSGNDFALDTNLTSRTGHKIGTWYDVVQARVSSSYMKMWIAPANQPAQGVWYQTTIGALASSGRNKWLGRAPFEQSGGVGNSGWAGEMAHYEYWSEDMTLRAGWLHDWRPPMRVGQTPPSTLVRYMPMDERSGTTTLDYATLTSKTITGTMEWRNGFTWQNRHDGHGARR